MLIYSAQPLTDLSVIKTTFDAGELIPIYADEMLPGDTFSCKTNSLRTTRNTNTSNHG